MFVGSASSHSRRRRKWLAGHSDMSVYCVVRVAGRTGRTPCGAVPATVLRMHCSLLRPVVWVGRVWDGGARRSRGFRVVELGVEAPARASARMLLRMVLGRAGGGGGPSSSETSGVTTGPEFLGVVILDVCLIFDGKYLGAVMWCDAEGKVCMLLAKVVSQSIRGLYVFDSGLSTVETLIEAHCVMSQPSSPSRVGQVCGLFITAMCDGKQEQRHCDARENGK